MISPDCVIERKVTVEDYKPNIPSPIVFNIVMRNKKQVSVDGVTFKEAKALEEGLKKARLRMCKNPNKRRVNQYK